MEGSGLPLTDGSDGADVWVGPLPVSTVPLLTRGGREAVPGSRTGSGRLHKGLPERLPPGLFFAVAGFEAGRHSSTVPRLPPSGARGSASLNRQSWWSGDRGKAPNCFHNSPFSSRGCAAPDGRVGESGCAKGRPRPLPSGALFCRDIGLAAGGRKCIPFGKMRGGWTKKTAGRRYDKDKEGRKKTVKKEVAFWTKGVGAGLGMWYTAAVTGRAAPSHQSLFGPADPTGGCFLCLCPALPLAKKEGVLGRNQTERELRTCATRF